jgi:hypothetical protein
MLFELQVSPDVLSVAGGTDATGNRQNFLGVQLRALMPPSRTFLPEI